MAAGAKKLPKYLLIKQALMERIARKEYAGSIPVPPEKELAAELGAAPMTVRRAIGELVDEGVLVRQRGRGKGTFVREERGVPYLARGANGKLRRMGVLHRQDWEALRASPVYFLTFMDIQAECARNGVGLEFLPHGDGLHEGAAGIRRLAESSGSQILVVLDWWQSEDLLEVQAGGLPVIVPGPFQETVPLSSVCPNDYQGAYAATRYLLELGHERVALVGSRKEIKTTTDRAAGWLAAVGMQSEDAAGLVYRAGRSGARSGQSFEEVVGDLVEQFGQRPPPSAVFARDGFFAYAAMRALEKTGRSCPQDTSMTCIGTYYEKSLGLPRMTAAQLAEGALGRSVVRLAQDLVSGRQDAPAGMVLPMQVVEGESTRPAG